MLDPVGLHLSAQQVPGDKYRAILTVLEVSTQLSTAGPAWAAQIPAYDLTDVPALTDLRDPATTDSTAQDDPVDQPNQPTDQQPAKAAPDPATAAPAAS